MPVDEPEAPSAQEAPAWSSYLLPLTDISGQRTYVNMLQLRRIYSVDSVTMVDFGPDQYEPVKEPLEVAAKLFGAQMAEIIAAEERVRIWTRNHYTEPA